MSVFSARRMLDGVVAACRSILPSTVEVRRGWMPSQAASQVYVLVYEAATHSPTAPMRESHRYRCTGATATVQNVAEGDVLALSIGHWLVKHTVTAGQGNADVRNSLLAKLNTTVEDDPLEGVDVDATATASATSAITIAPTFAGSVSDVWAHPSAKWSLSQTTAVYRSIGGNYLSTVVIDVLGKDGQNDTVSETCKFLHAAMRMREVRVHMSRRGFFISTLGSPMTLTGIVVNEPEPREQFMLQLNHDAFHYRSTIQVDAINYSGTFGDVVHTGSVTR